MTLNSGRGKLARASGNRGGEQGRSATDVDPAVFNWPVIQPMKDAYAVALQDQFEETQWWPQERLLSHQLRRIQGLIDHAARTVPFYRERLASLARLTPGMLTLEAFREIPPLRRTDIQSAGDALISRSLPKGHGRSFKGSTSGSTGHPVEFRGTDITDMFARAFALRSYLWHRLDITAKKVSVLPAKYLTDKRLKWASVADAGPLIRLDIADPINELYDEVLREDPGYLTTHPIVLMGLIERSVEIGLAPSNLCALLAFGEPVEPELREAALTHWDVPIIDNYSATEVGPIAIQCPDTTKLHIQSEGILVEVLDDYGRPRQPGEVGRVVMTSLHNFATPFIRYEIGDYACVAGACSCGRNLPTLESIAGRERTLLQYPSGDRSFPHFRFGRLSNIAPIRQYQLTQKTLEQIEVKVVTQRPLTDDEEGALRAALTERLRFAFEYTFVYVDEIPRAANGKFFEFQSEIPVRAAS